MGTARVYARYSKSLLTPYSGAITIMGMDLNFSEATCPPSIHVLLQRPTSVSMLVGG